MKKGKLKISTWIYMAGLFVIGISIAILYYYCVNESKKPHTYVFTSENLDIPQDYLRLTVSITKKWTDDALQPEMPCGAQYDGILTNDSNRVFKDWTAEMVFSDATMIDSSWNGEFTVKGNKVIFVAKGDPATVAAKGYRTFGAVMYAENFMELESYTLTGYSVVKMQDTAVFYILTAALLLWIMICIMHIVFRFQTRYYRERQKIDEKIINQSMNMFTGFIDAKDTYTKGHSTRVAEYTAEIGKRMKLNNDEVTKLYQIALMHDCGKLGIPDAILKKSGSLTNEEYNIIKLHTTMGDEILVNFTEISGIRDGAHYHHERYDGKGYPSGLTGKDIPFCARIICVADSFDAMNSNRCYRKRLDEETIIRELRENAGKQFDPEIVEYMIDMMKDGFVEKVEKKYPYTIIAAEN